MPSIRELLPYLIGGAAGALGGQDAARGIQSAAAWSHKLREDERSNERRDQAMEQSVRRLELAERADKRGAESHKQRTSVTARQAAKQEKEWQREEEIRSQTRLAIAETAKQLEAEGVDPSVLAGITTHAELRNFRRDHNLDRPTNAEGREQLAGADLQPGESMSVWTRDGQLTRRGASVATSGTGITPRMLSNMVDGVAVKGDSKIMDLEEDLEDAQADFHLWRQENPTGGGGIGEGGSAIDNTGRTLMKKVARARRAIERQHRETLLAIENKLISAGVSDAQIEKIMSRISGSAPAAQEAAAAVAADDGVGIDPVQAALDAQFQPEIATDPTTGAAYTPTPGPNYGAPTTRQLQNREPGGLLPPPKR